jgi:Uma2 family endonuclease
MPEPAGFGVFRPEVLLDPHPGGTVGPMTHPAPMDPVAPPRWTVDAYLRLAADGVLGPDDRVELLEGVIVAMAPSNVAHDGTLGLVSQALFHAVGRRATVRVQLSLVASPHSLPEPDVAVVPGTARDYERRRPDTALLVVEVSDTSLTQDRLTKGAIYAAAGFPEYWIVNVGDECVEVRRNPDRRTRRYASVRIARRGEVLEPAGLAAVRVAVDDLLPAPR